MRLTIKKIQTQPSAATFVLTGELNNQTSNRLQEAISNMLDVPAKTLVLDMQQVTFISSSGIGVIVKARNTLKEKGQSLTMVNVQPQVKRVFDIMQLTPILKVCENQEELDSYLTKIQDRIIEDGTSVTSM